MLYTDRLLHNVQEVFAVRSKCVD